MREINNIVIHHSAGAMTIDKIRQIHVVENGWSTIGYHYVISPQDGTWRAYACKPTIIKGSHCIKRNRDSIGVCVCGNYEISDLPEEAYAALFDLCIRLLVRWEIDPEAITGHFKWKNTACPGKNIKKILTVLITELRDTMPLEMH